MPTLYCPSSHSVEPGHLGVTPHGSHLPVDKSSMVQRNGAVSQIHFTGVHLHPRLGNVPEQNLDDHLGVILSLEDLEYFKS